MHTAGAPRPARHPLALAAVACAHVALLLGLAQALREPKRPLDPLTLSVQLLSADTPPPAPVPLPAPRVPAPAPPAPVWAPPPTVVLAEAPATPLASPAPPAPAPALPQPVAPVVMVQAPVPAPPAPAPAPAPVPERQIAIDQVAYLEPPVLQYPLAARRLREQGQVLVRVRVDESGRPSQTLLQQTSGSRLLDEAALAAVAATRFKPYREGGVARPFWVLMPLVFSLDS
jgi:protein TonB